MKRKLISIAAVIMMIIMCACAQTGGDGQSEAPKEEQNTDRGITFEEYIEEKNAGSEELDDAA